MLFENVFQFRLFSLHILSCCDLMLFENVFQCLAVAHKGEVVVI